MSGMTADRGRAPKGTLPAETLEFLRALHPAPQGLIEMRLVFHDKENPQPYSLFFADIPDVEAAAEQIMAKNAVGFHVFAGVGLRRERSGKKEDILSVGALWVDLDAKDFSDDVEEGKRLARNLLRTKLAADLQPSVIIDSGHGYHGYWLLKLPAPVKNGDDLQKLESAVAGLGDLLNGDYVHDLGRVLRLPGTSNVKDPTCPRPCVIIEADYTRRFNIAAFERFAIPLNRIEQAEAVVFNKKLPYIALDTLRVSPRIKSLIQVGKTDG